MEEKPSPTSPLRSSCQQDCSCICHLQWPGMKLVWVPVEEEEEEDVGEEEAEEKEEELEDHCRNEEELEDEEDCEEEVEGTIAEVVNCEALKATRSKFQQSLDVLIAEHHRRRSDPGPPAALTFAVTRCRSPPVPPKLADHKPLHQQEEEGESVYESILQLLVPPPRKVPPECKELDIPLIRVRKPARRSKLSYSTSDPTSDFQSPTELLPSPQEEPPAIPPRRPLNQEGRSPTSALRGAVALPQPTAEEWQVLRQSPQHSTMATTPPPPSISPVRAPPAPPPKTDPRRLSTASVQSLTNRKGL